MKKHLYIFISLLTALLISLSPLGGFIYAKDYSDDPGKLKYEGKDFNEFNSDGRSSKKQLSGTSFSTKSKYSGSTYTQNGRFEGYTVTNGVDVSYWNGTNINWTKVKNDGIKFAFVRAAYRGVNSSSIGNDSTFARNMKEANNAGLQVGAYIFSQALNKTEAVEEANRLISLVKPYKVNLPLVMDYEYASGRFKAGKISKKKATANVNAFVSTVKKAGYTPMLYASTSFLDGQLNMSDINCKVWVAQYNSRNTYTGSYEYWQYSSSGKVAGIKGKTDVNFRYIKPAAAATPTTLTFTWTKVSDSDGYIVYRYSSSTKKYEQIKTITDPSVTFFKDSGLSPATVYTYKVASYKGKTSNTTVIKTGIKLVTLPEKVKSLRKYAKTKTSITIKWNKVKNASGYEVYRYSGKKRKYLRLKRTTALSFKNTGLTKGLKYRYKVRAYKLSEGKYHEGSFCTPLTVKTKGKYLKKMSRKGKVKSSTLNVRKGGGTEYSKVVTIKKKTKVKVKGYTKDLNRNKWYKIKVVKNGKTYKGYVYASYITLL